MRLLIVDDDVVVRDALVRMISREFKDAEILAAADGEEAIRVFAQAQPEVVIMDVRMPRLDGFSAAKAIHATHPETKILMVTAYTEEEVAKSVLDDINVVAWLLKPFPVDTLFDVLRPVLTPDTERRHMPRGHNIRMMIGRVFP